MHRVVTVFGSAITPPCSPQYALAEELGQLLARAGAGVCTGGYGGIMEAVSKGAREAGGAVIGITCDKIFRTRRANPYLSREIPERDLLHRMLRLVAMGDAYVALPGSTGTLAEVFYVWNRMLVGELHRKPLILLGDAWQTVMDTLRKLHMIDPTESKVVHTVREAKQAVELALTDTFGSLPPERFEPGS